MAILSAPVVPVVTPPDSALMVAVPDRAPALNTTMARPPESVSASTGMIAPRSAVKVTSVPLFGGVPAGSMTCAMMLVDPFRGTVDVSAESVIVDPAGANSATRSHEIETTATVSAMP
jgi:hypothetical protein